MSECNALELLGIAEQLRPRLLGVARRYLGCPFLAEDVLQDVLLRILSEQAPSDIEFGEAYLTRMVRNLAIDRARRQRFESRIFVPGDEDHWASAAGGLCPAATVQAHQALRLLEGALQELPEQITAAFRMHRVEGVAQKKVAETMGVSRALVCEFVRRGHEHCLAALAAEVPRAAPPDAPKRALRKGVCAGDGRRGKSPRAVAHGEKRERNGASYRLGERSGCDDAVKPPKGRKNGEQRQENVTLRGE